MNDITVNGYGKINLALDILGRLPNGYHEVFMVMQQIELCDRISIKKTGRGRREITITTDKDGVPVDYRNLAYQAAQIMLGLYEILDGVEIHIEKNIPMEAGLAGGSADCAATLIAMNQLFDMKLTTKALCQVGAKLGADVPFCILGGTAIAQGTGTRLNSVKGMDPGKYTVVLCKPAEGISTAAVYRKYSERLEEMAQRSHPDIANFVDDLENELPLKDLKKNMINVLEYITAEELPVVKEIEKIMEDNGAVTSLMTGSGPTVYGIFEKSETAAVAYSKLAPLFEETYITFLR